MLTRVLLSVKPRFAEAILAGEKTFEFRRALFRRPNVRMVVLYASSPVCRVVGEFHLDDVLTLDLDALWAKTHRGGGYRPKLLRSVFRGVHNRTCVEGSAPAQIPATIAFAR